jgi:hypothetical protein
VETVYFGLETIFFDPQKIVSTQRQSSAGWRRSTLAKVDLLWPRENRLRRREGLLWLEAIVSGAEKIFCGPAEDPD